MNMNIAGMSFDFLFNAVPTNTANASPPPSTSTSATSGSSPNVASTTSTATSAIDSAALSEIEQLLLQNPTDFELGLDLSSFSPPIQGHDLAPPSPSMFWLWPSLSQPTTAAPPTSSASKQEPDVFVFGSQSTTHHPSPVLSDTASPPPSSAPAPVKRGRKRKELTAEEAEKKMQDRMKANREAAQSSRDKKRRYVDELENTNKNLLSRLESLESQNSTLLSRIEEMAAQLGDLRGLVRTSSSSSGFALPGGGSGTTFLASSKPSPFSLRFIQSITPSLWGSGTSRANSRSADSAFGGQQLRRSLVPMTFPTKEGPFVPMEKTEGVRRLKDIIPSSAKSPPSLFSSLFSAFFPSSD